MRIIYFDIDSLRPDHLGCYGYSRPTSPNIDRIAEEGARFNHCYCASSPCLPSRTAWTSGRFGIRNGVVSNHSEGAQFHLRCNHYGGAMEDTMLLPRQLRRLGVHTASVSTFADRHAAYYFMCGFTDFHTPNLKCGAETAEEVTEAALNWLEHNTHHEHSFLHINYWDVHRRYEVDQKWHDLLDSAPVEQTWPDAEAIDDHYRNVTGPFSATGQFKDNISISPLMPGKISTREEFEHMVTGYDATIACVDHHVGRIRQWLEERGLMEDTAIIVSGDHGDAFGEHGIYSDHVCADECIHKIPLVISWPGVTKPGHVSDEFLYNLDIGPTLCDLFEGEAPSDWDGASFRKNMEGEPGLDRDYLVWDHGLYTAQRAVRTKTHLMIRTYDQGDFSHFAEVELYDMIADPYQTKNLAKELPEVVEHCDRLLGEWIAEQQARGDRIPDPLALIVEKRNAAGVAVKPLS